MNVASSLAFFFGNGHHRKGPDDSPAGDMRPLGEAAISVLATMRKRGYPLAGVASLNRTEEEASAWVARNMLQIVPVYEKDGDGWRRADRGPVAGRTLAIPPSSIAAYLEWAKNVY